MNGVLNLLKPPGMTSHDAVSAVRRIFGQKRVGHAGTLDPGACGVLPIFLGWATRLMPYIDGKKSYRAEMTLGISTDTQDASGSTVDVAETVHVTPKQLGEAFSSFVGLIEQVPPMVSAVRVQGKRLYELAREGKEVERQPRKVSIQELHIIKVWPDDTDVLGFCSRVLFDVDCSAGTYVRTLCTDIGTQLGCGGHMSFLVRTYAAGCLLADAITFEELQTADKEGRLSETLRAPDAVLQHLPGVDADEIQHKRISFGQAFTAAEVDGETVRVHNSAGELLAIAKSTDRRGVYQPERVFPSAQERGEA